MKGIVATPSRNPNVYLVGSNPERILRYSSSPVHIKISLQDADMESTLAALRATNLVRALLQKLPKTLKRTPKKRGI